MAKIRKASDSEKRQYAAGYPVHPLFGFLKVRGRLGSTMGFWQCAVEYLGEGKDEPNYEVLAPDGMHFAPDGTHTLLGTTQADLIGRIGSLAECCDNCDCKPPADVCWCGVSDGAGRCCSRGTAKLKRMNATRKGGE